jgi:hypothetical protein
MVTWINRTGRRLRLRMRPTTRLRDLYYGPWTTAILMRTPVFSLPMDCSAHFEDSNDVWLLGRWRSGNNKARKIQHERSRLSWRELEGMLRILGGTLEMPAATLPLSAL